MPVWGTVPLKVREAEHPLGRDVCELKIFVEHPPSWGVEDVVDHLMDTINGEITDESRLFILGAINTTNQI